jgi:hypothetical protein
MQRRGWGWGFVDVGRWMQRLVTSVSFPNLNSGPRTCTDVRRMQATRNSAGALSSLYYTHDKLCEAPRVGAT